MWFLVSLFIFILVISITKHIKHIFLNPMLICLVIIIMILKLAGISYESYYADNAWLAYPLQLSVVALAFPLYQNFHVIKSNYLIIIIACALSSLISMLSAGLIAIYFDLDNAVIASLMTKSVTTAVALEITKTLEGNMALTSVFVMIAGLFGAVFAYPVFKLLRLSSHLAKGICIGSVSHVIGTVTASEHDLKDSAFGSLALICCALITSMTAPWVYRVLLILAPYLK